MSMSEEVYNEVKQFHIALLDEVNLSGKMTLSWEDLREVISKDEYSSFLTGWFLAKGKAALIRDNFHSNFKTIGV